MKIRINDFLLSDFCLDIVSEIIKSEMERIIEDETEWALPEDQEYQDNLRIAAAHIYNHHAEPRDQYEIIDWEE